jgi:hypothetical protein
MVGEVEECVHQDALVRLALVVGVLSFGGVRGRGRGGGADAAR